MNRLYSDRINSIDTKYEELKETVTNAKRNFEYFNSPDSGLRKSYFAANTRLEQLNYSFRNAGITLETLADFEYFSHDVDEAFFLMKDFVKDLSNAKGAMYNFIKHSHRAKQDETSYKGFVSYLDSVNERVSYDIKQDKARYKINEFERLRKAINTENIRPLLETENNDVLFSNRQVSADAPTKLFGLLLSHYESFCDDAVKKLKLTTQRKGKVIDARDYFTNMAS